MNSDLFNKNKCLKQSLEATILLVYYLLSYPPYKYIDQIIYYRVYFLIYLDLPI